MLLILFLLLFFRSPAGPLRAAPPHRPLRGRGGQHGRGGKVQQGVSGEGCRSAERQRFYSNNAKNVSPFFLFQLQFQMDAINCNIA